MHLHGTRISKIHNPQMYLGALPSVASCTSPPLTTISRGTFPFGDNKVASKVSLKYDQGSRPQGFMALLSVFSRPGRNLSGSHLLSPLPSVSPPSWLSSLLLTYLKSSHRNRPSDGNRKKLVLQRHFYKGSERPGVRLPCVRFQPLYACFSSTGLRWR